MLRRLLAAGTLAMALAAATPALAQQTPAQPPSAEAEAVVGLPVYSSDGQKLGEVTQVGMSAGQRALRAEIGAFLGIGPSAVIIPADMFEQKPDRIEVAMTAAEVRETVSQQRQQQQKQ